MHGRNWCALPMLPPDARHAVDQRTRWMELSAIVGKEAAAKKLQLTDRDIDLIIFIEAEMRKMRAEGNNNGRK